MTTKIHALSPQFDRSAAEAIGVLGSASVQLQRMCAVAGNRRDENDLMYLSSLALLAAHRGRHLVDEIPAVDVVDAARGAAVEDLSALLASTHDELIEHTSGLDEFVVLEFVGEVGALCRGVRRYVEHH